MNSILWTVTLFFSRFHASKIIWLRICWLRILKSDGSCLCVFLLFCCCYHEYTIFTRLFLTFNICKWTVYSNRKQKNVILLLIFIFCDRLTFALIANKNHTRAECVDRRVMFYEIFFFDFGHLNFFRNPPI